MPFIYGLNCGYENRLAATPFSCRNSRAGLIEPVQKNLGHRFCGLKTHSVKKQHTPEGVCYFLAEKEGFEPSRQFPDLLPCSRLLPFWIASTGKFSKPILLPHFLDFSLLYYQIAALANILLKKYPAVGNSGILQHLFSQWHSNIIGKFSLPNCT